MEEKIKEKLKKNKSFITVILIIGIFLVAYILYLLGYQMEGFVYEKF